jgi:leucyl aminopeptidase
VLGVGPKPGHDAEERLKIAAGEAFAIAMKRKPARIVMLCDQIPPDRVRFLLEGVALSTYRFDRYKSKKSDPLPVLVLCGKADAAVASQAQLSIAQTVLEATELARDLVNEPGSALPPKIFADRIEAAANAVGLKVRVRNRSELEKEGFEGLVTVGKGSSNEPLMLVLEYRPKGISAGPHLALVGKGVTFDTGGISLKPGDKMWEMKNDMAGGAAVCGAILAIARLQLPLAVTAIVCLAENRPGDGSVLPGDIFKARNGKTVMVDNTDAEGRLVLTDGLFEAGSVGATHVVDLATLTGSIVRALGPSIAGLFANDDTLAGLLIESGQKNGEKYWRMPMEAEYRDRLDDSVADMRNIGGADAGAITAALFLQEFVPEGVAWAHLDIAATAFVTKSWKYFKDGATGFGIPTLVEYARRLSTR